jgi:hypothetical protein
MTTYDAMRELVAVLQRQRDEIPEHIWEAQDEEQTWLMHSWNALCDLEYHLENGNRKPYEA